MRSLAFLVIALALLAPVSAAQYWTVVGDDIEDVLAGANFAASMKGALGVEFQGKTLEQAQRELPTRSDPVFIAYLDSGEAYLLGAAAFDSDARVMETYLADQGYDVHRERDFSEIMPEEVPEPEPEPEGCPADAKICWDGSTVARDPEDCSRFLPCPAQPIAQVSPEEPLEITESIEQPEPPQPNVFVRAWRWFAGLFG